MSAHSGHNRHQPNSNGFVVHHDNEDDDRKLGSDAAVANAGAGNQEGKADYSGVHGFHQGMRHQPRAGRCRPCSFQEDGMGPQAHEAQPSDLCHHHEGSEGGLTAPPGLGRLPWHAPRRSLPCHRSSVPAHTNSCTCCGRLLLVLAPLTHSSLTRSLARSPTHPPTHAKNVLKHSRTCEMTLCDAPSQSKH